MSFKTPDFFEFGGKSSAEFGLFLTERPELPVNVRRVTSYAIPGRNGSLHIDDGSFEDAEIKVNCKFEGTATDAQKIAEWLASDHGNPQKIRFSAFPDLSWLGIIVGGASIKYQLFNFSKFSLTFRVNPKKYIGNGLDAVEFPFTGDPAWVRVWEIPAYNPGTKRAYPVIRVNVEDGQTQEDFVIQVQHGSGDDAEITTALQISAFSGWLEIDCENGDAYGAEGTMNSHITYGDAEWVTHRYSNLYLDPGENTLTFIFQNRPRITSAVVTGGWWAE